MIIILKLKGRIEITLLLTLMVQEEMERKLLVGRGVLL